MRECRASSACARVVRARVVPVRECASARVRCARVRECASARVRECASACARESCASRARVVPVREYCASVCVNECSSALIKNLDKFKKIPSHLKCKKPSLIYRSLLLRYQKCLHGFFSGNGPICHDMIFVPRPGNSVVYASGHYQTFKKVYIIFSHFWRHGILRNINFAVNVMFLENPGFINCCANKLPYLLALKIGSIILILCM